MSQIFKQVSCFFALSACSLVSHCWMPLHALEKLVKNFSPALSPRLILIESSRYVVQDWVYFRQLWISIWCCIVYWLKLPVVVIVCVAVEIVYRCAVDATGAVKIADVCMRLGFGTLRHNNSLSPICRSANEKRSHQICVRYSCVLYFAQMRRTDDASSELKTHRICRSMGKLIN